MTVEESKPKDDKSTDVQLRTEWANTSDGDFDADQRHISLWTKTPHENAEEKLEEMSLADIEELIGVTRDVQAEHTRRAAEAALLRDALMNRLAKVYLSHNAQSGSDSGVSISSKVE